MKATNSNASPKEIEIVVKLPNQWAHYPGRMIPQLEQLPPLESLRGIYRFELLEDGTQRLIWCFSQSGMLPPGEFKASPGSQRTLVTMERLDQTTSNTPWAESIVANKLLAVFAN